MSLPAYGVAIGTFLKMKRDPSKKGTYGKWYHGHLELTLAKARKWSCAIDVNTPEGRPMLYAVVHDLDRDAIKKVLKLGPGVHKLKSTPSSGALDYVRSKALRTKKWKTGKADAILDKIEARAKASARVYVFGDVYKNQKKTGTHDVHMNQGDPDDSQWFKWNGIWQDGATVHEAADGTLTAILTRFPNQSMKTDDDGNPIV